MALSQQNRTQLHDTLSPIVGEAAIEALLSEFPATELDKPASQAFVRAEVALTRTELKTDIAGLRTELKTDIAGLRTELKTDIAGLRTEIAVLRGDVNAGMATLEATVSDRLRQQTLWTFGALMGGIGAATAIATAIARFAG